MIDHNGAWMLSVSLGVPTLVFAVLILTGFYLFIITKCEDAEEFWMATIFAAIIILPTAITPFFTYWPYNGDYHRLQPVTGTVKTIDSRMLATSQYVVVTYDSGLTVRCDDTRCVNIKVGDSIRLLCTREWEYGTVNGWGCKWGMQNGE